MQTVQSEMYEDLLIAMDRIKKLSSKAEGFAELQIRQVIALKYELEAIAARKGYSQACKTSIHVCKGDCCKWHFPKNLNHIDFFISIFHMPEERQIKMAEQIFNSKKSGCPLLLKAGCFLSFEQRPILCTNAYPCFADRSYWVEKEKKNLLFKKVFSKLQGILDFSVNDNTDTIKRKGGENANV